MSLEAAARRDDPIQSYAAADRKNASGTLSYDRWIVLAYIKAHPNQTAKQLDRTFLNGKAHRRSADLERLGYITRTKQGKEMTMLITEKGLSRLSINNKILKKTFDKQ